MAHPGPIACWRVWQFATVSLGSPVQLRRAQSLNKTRKRRALIRRQLHFARCRFLVSAEPALPHSLSDPPVPSRAEINVRRRSRPRHQLLATPLSFPSEPAWREARTGQGRPELTSRPPRYATRDVGAGFSLRRSATVYQRRLRRPAFCSPHFRRSLALLCLSPYPPSRRSPLPPTVVGRSPQARTRPVQL
jgi:hypothetical protein